MNALEQLHVLNPDWHDLFEILIVAYVMYRVLLLFHGTRAVQMAVGIVLLFAAYAVAWLLKLGTITYLLGLVFTYGAFALLVRVVAARRHVDRARPPSKPQTRGPRTYAGPGSLGGTESALRR